MSRVTDMPSQENIVLKALIAGSLLVSPLLLTGCGKSGEQAGASTSVEDARWSDATVQQLRKAIDARAAHGLDRINFDIKGDTGSAEGQAALTQTALHYAGALALGAANPTKLHEIYTLPRPKGDLKLGLAQAIANAKVDAWLESLAPQDESYRKLSKAYLALRGGGNSKPAPGATSIPAAAEPLKPSETDKRVPIIARQLVASDYLPAAQASNGHLYTQPMVRAVKQMQADYGIDPDGVVGDDVLEVLNLSDADRARVIAVAMERARWLERVAPETRIDVNIAAARLNYWRDGKLIDSRRVVVGKPEHETPQLGSPIWRLVANPTWTVPRSIEKRELAGKSAAYLRRNNMARKDGWIVQQPGPKNSLGLVKFDMKNEHLIYLHDTPAKQLFNEVQRQRSHGCVRVQDALGFAELLARDGGVIDEWNKARATGKESFVKLPREIPVRLLYQTVVFDQAGEPVIRADPYGWNEKVSTALGFPASRDMRLRAAVGDVGP